MRPARSGEAVRVAGWVHRRRDHGGLIFVDLRDRSGLLQLVFRPERTEVHERAHRLRAEDVLTARGTLERRDPGNVNPGLPTGEVELAVEDFELLADAEPPPFPIDEEGALDEVLRLRWRPLDLRRKSMAEMLALRHAVVRSMREYLDAHDFLSVDTPILTRSTPEGARDYLVPARVQPGSFYALPQSPQLFKQLLMVAGVERYYQVARCFRDEDSRADRQPEFSQLDLEMSFVEEDDVIETIEGMMARVFETAGLLGVPAPPYPRLRYDDVVAAYGTDRPDRRFGMEIRDLGDLLTGSEFKVFASALRDGGVVRALNAGALDLPRSELDALEERAKQLGAKGLVWAIVEEGATWRSPVAKFLSEDELSGIDDRLGAGPGDLVLAVADRPEVAASVLGQLRLDLAERFELIPHGRHDLFWVVDFPLLAWNGDEERWDPMHHPFTAPSGDLDEPGALGSRAYDLVLNGSEIGGGSIRIHRRDVQERVFAILGIPAEEAQERFGFLLDHLRHGAPPHGGIAMGLDRILAVLAGRDSIRDVIPFPKTATGADPLTGAPAAVEDIQLRQLGLRVGGAGGKPTPRP